MSTLATPEEAIIERRVGRRGFRRGRDYFLSGAVFDTRRQGPTIKAACAGRSMTAYRVEATLNEQGIVDASCSCPVGAGGSCKHVAALLIAWREKPHDFVEVETLDAVLARYQREQLVDLVKQLISRQPELEAVIETTPHDSNVIHVPPSPQSYREKVVALLRSEPGEPADPAERATRRLTELRMVKETADTLVKHRELTAATEAYRAMLEEFFQYAEANEDLPAEADEFVDACVQSLGRLLAETGEPAEVRSAVLQTLWEVYRFDLCCRETIRQDVPMLVLQHADAMERQTFSAKARELLSQASGRMVRRALGGLVLQLEAGRLDDEAFVDLCRQAGRILELVRRLVHQGRVAEAVREAREADTCDLVKIADLLVRHRHAEAAAQLVRSCYETTHREAALQKWLARYEAGQAEQQKALELTVQLFRLQPDLEVYRRLRRLGRQLGVWDKLHSELLVSLEQAGQTRLLVTIHLDENDIDRALELVVSPTLQTTGLGLTLEVARAAERTRPDEALAIYQAHAERLINQSDGGQHSEAVFYLRKVRSLMRRTGAAQAWSSYITRLREQYGSLKALIAELDAAHL